MEAHSLALDAIEKRERDRCAACVPTNWCDSLLTGPSAVLGQPPFNCKDIERLLLNIKRRIQMPDIASGARVSEAVKRANIYRASRRARRPKKT